MRSILVKLTFAAVAVMAFVGCKDDERNLNTNVTAVQSFYTPAQGLDMVLKPAASASLFFEWEQARADDGGLVMYEVVFDKKGGDFSKPLYRALADNGGLNNSATITHKVLNKVAGYAGVGAAEKAELIWTIASSKGINGKLSSLVRELSVTRLAGFEVIPTSIFVMGDGVDENGTDLANAMAARSTSVGEFEICIKLTANKKITLVDGIGAEHRSFDINENGIIVENMPIDFTVDKSGVYFMTFDFTTGASTIVSAKDDYIQMSWCDEQMQKRDEGKMAQLKYKGNGVWESPATQIDFMNVGWMEERHKFTLNIDNDSDPIMWFGHILNNQGGAMEHPVRHIPTAESIMDGGFQCAYKFSGTCNGKLVIMKIDLNAAEPKYTTILAN